MDERCRLVGVGSIEKLHAASAPWTEAFIYRKSVSSLGSHLELIWMLGIGFFAA